MTETIRCPSCRGMKKVPKLGGMIGECNTCKGKGNILAVDKPVKAEPVADEVISKDLLNAVEGSVVASTLGLQPIGLPLVGNADISVVTPTQSSSNNKVIVDAIKVAGKKAIFKRKSG